MYEHKGVFTTTMQLYHTSTKRLPYEKFCYKWTIFLGMNSWNYFKGHPRSCTTTIQIFTSISDVLYVNCTMFH